MRYLTFAILAASLLCACKRTPPENSARMIDSGKQYLAKKDYAHAIIQFRRAIQYTPQEAEVYYQAGLTYLNMLDIPSAYVNFKKATELNPKHAGAQTRLAELLSASHDPAKLREASERAREVLKLAPEDVSALNTLAITEFELGKASDAEAHLREAIGHASDDDRTAVNLALMRLYKKDPQGALTVLKDAAQRNPKSTGAALVLGRMYAAMNDAAGAEREFRRAVVLDPKNAKALMALAGLLSATKRDSEAELTYQKISSLPDKPYRPILGLYYWRTGKRDAAIAEFALVVKTDASDRQARNRLVAAYRAMGREADADKVLETAYNRNPKDAEAMLGHAQSLARMGKLDDAANLLRLLVADSRDSVQGHYLLSKIYAAKSQPRLQQQELEEALKINPMFLAARLDMSQSLLAMHRPDAALDVLDHTPPDQKKSLLFLVGRNWALLAKGEHEELRRQLDVSLKHARIPDFLFQDALLNMQLKQYAAARTSLNELLAKDAQNTRSLEILAESRAAERRPDLAFAALAGAARKYPHSSGVQYLYATWLSRAGKIEQAREALMAAKTNSSDNAGIDIRLAELAFAQSRFSDARNLLAPVLARNNKIGRAQMMMGNIESVGGNAPAAIARYRAVLELEPDNAEAMNNLASIMTEAKSNIDEALRFAQKAKELVPDNPNYNDTLGWVLYKKGLYSSAVEYLQVAANSGRSLSKYHLSMAYAQSGNRLKASHEYEEAHRASPSLPEAKAAEALLIAAAHLGR